MNSKTYTNRNKNGYTLQGLTLKVRAKLPLQRILPARKAPKAGYHVQNALFYNETSLLDGWSLSRDPPRNMETADSFSGMSIWCQYVKDLTAFLCGLMPSMPMFSIGVLKYL